MKMNCGFCKKPYDKPGALLFSPPMTDTGLVIKFHICTYCFHRLVAQDDLRSVVVEDTSDAQK